MKKGRARLRFKAKDRARLDRQLAKPRADFVAEFPHCWNCGQGPTQCDEMVSGMSDRKKGIQHRETWGALCGRCNCDVLNGSSREIVLTKLVLKMRFDPEHCDPALVMRLKGWSEKYITKADVIVAYHRRYLL